MKLRHRLPRQKSWLWWGLFFLGIALVGFLIAFMAGLLPQAHPPTLSPAVPIGASSADMSELTGTETPALVARSSEPSAPSVTLIGPNTPADAWANAVLDRVLEYWKTPAGPGDGFAWWQNRDAIGNLMYIDGALSLANARLDVGAQSQIAIMTPDRADPNALASIGEITQTETVVNLLVSGTAPSEGTIRWALVGSTAETALNGLVIQAAARSISLQAGYSSSGPEGILVLLPPSASATATSTRVASLPPGKPISTATPIPTPTRVPDAELGAFVASRLNPVIDAGLAFPKDVVDAFTKFHAWTGPLTWTEAGPQVSDKAINVNQADELTILILTPNDPRGASQPFMHLTYNGNITRFPEDQIYFSGQRMGEVIYWLVSITARRGGQLIISYDDFGTRQFITVVGYQPFASATTSSP